MAKTNDYLDYLDAQIGIAPANSQEELVASQCIAGLFEDHGLEATVQEFDAPSLGGLIHGALMVVLFLGAILSGIGGGASVLGIILALVSAGLLIAAFLGNDVLAGVGPKAKSQNVVARHEATGELAAKGNRPIVIVAHYDTPHASILANPAIAPYRAAVVKASVICVPLIFVCVVLQIMGFIPEVARRVFWVISILAALPPLALGVAAIAERFMPCTDGANDNKAAVAAMLGILDNVRPGVDVPKASEGVLPATTSSVEQAPVEEPCGTRHGKEVLEQIGMLPSDCEIVYVKPAPRPVETSSDTNVMDAMDPVAAPGDAAADIATPEPPAPRDGRTSPMPMTPASEEEEFDKDISGLDTLSDGDGSESTAAMDQPASSPAPKVNDPEWGKTSFKPGGNDFARRASLFDLPDPSAASSDPLDADDGFGFQAPTPGVPTIPVGSSDDTAAAPVAIPSSPVSSQDVRRPTPRNMSDNLASAGSRMGTMPAPVRLDQGSPDATQVAPAQSEYGAPAASPASVSDDIEVIHPAADGGSKGKRGKRPHLFGKRKHRQEDESMGEWLDVGDDFDAKESGEKIGTWDNFDGQDDGSDKDKGSASGHDRGDSWKGGAAKASFLRDVDDIPEGSDDPDMAEMREAILGMGDDALISHDIWFVATGASYLGHAGMKAFLGEYRKNIRGAFLVNLDCIGSGTPTVLTNEGLSMPRRADRRLVSLLVGTSDDLHTSLAKGDYSWSDTDATPAMRSSVRAATIMGVEAGGIPSLAQSPSDVMDAIDPEQVAAVSDLVTEAIRRS